MSRAKYFDGKSSKIHEADVQVWASNLEIRLVNNGQEQVLFFPIEEISAQDYMGDSVLLNLTNLYNGPQLEWQGEEADKFVREFLKNKSKIGFLEYTATHSSPAKVVFVGLGVLILVMGLYYFVLAPFTAEQIADKLPQNLEIQAGNQIAKEITSGLSSDTAKTLLLQQFYDGLNYPSSYPIRVTFLTDSTVNAFAIPGGRIYVYSGLVADTDNWQELAAVLSHELAHVNQRHSLKLISRAIAGYALLSIITGDMAGISALLIEYANDINNLANSRRFEKMADLQGIEYMEGSQINPKYMEQFFEKLNEKDESIDNANRTSQVLSSHPLSSKRIAYIHEEIGADTLWSTPPNSNELQKLWKQLRK